VTTPQEWRLETRHVGRRVLVYPRLESTNSEAAALAVDPANAGTVVLADEQSAGRGRQGRSWDCPPGTGVLLSVLVFPPPELRRPAVLTAWAAVSVCETVRRAAGLRAVIKWPNDVLVRGRKVCGILIEQGLGTVVGIGLNVNQTAAHFAGAGLGQAGSLALFAGRPLDVRQTARLLIEQLDAQYDRMCRGDLAGLEGEWRRHVGLAGREVAVECLETVHRGRLRALNWSGVELELSEGDVLRLAPEAVQHLGPA
jgi:BirA family biotin operon repressor/biotin-[acetyl-CoA-carboxylase] ligase